MLIYLWATLLALASLLTCTSPVSAIESTARRLNVVLIVADDLGWSDVGCYVPHLEDGHPGEYLTDRLTDEALKLIDAAGDQPFFLYLAHHAVHIPIQPKPELVDHYVKKSKPGQHHRSPKYAAMVQSLDESVGRVLDRLEQRGLAERTVVVFVSDNGGYINNFDKVPVTSNFPLRSGKGSLYEGGIRVPLIIRWPNAQSARGTCSEPVYVADLFPTLLEITGLLADPKVKLDGQSLVPLLKVPSASLKRDALYFHFPHYYYTTAPASAIRSGDWKLLEYLEDNRLELYNLRDDLRESKNLADQQPEKARDLHARLAQWRNEIHAQMPAVNPEFRPKH